MRSVLIIGASGVFGQRLALHLVSWPEIELIVASRSETKARALAANLLNRPGTRAKVRGISLDHRARLAERLLELRPWTVVNCSGPFQGGSYEIPKAALAAGAHFIDLADAPDYLQGFASVLDRLARNQKRLVLAGASSTPALSCTVAREIASSWQRVDRIEIGIMPGGDSEVGRAVIAGVLTYAGRPVPVWREGKLATATGWRESRRIEVPGIGTRRVSVVETIDAVLLGPTYGATLAVTFYAGLESALEQFSIEILAQLRSLGLIKDLHRLSFLLHRARRLTRHFNGKKGVMIVLVTGLNAAGEAVIERWQLTATKGQGPNVPILPAAAILRKLIRGKGPTGAMLAPDFLSLDEIEAELSPYSIVIDSQTKALGQGLFRQALGQGDFERLPRAVRQFHDVQAFPLWAGVAQVKRGDSLAARIIGKIVGLPEKSPSVAVTVAVTRGFKREQEDSPQEVWTRSFNEKKFSSCLTCPTPSQFRETFGVISFTLDLEIEKESLTMPLAAWHVFGIPMPRRLGPRSISSESQDAIGRFCFDVRLELPFFGLLAHYQGWLLPKSNEIHPNPSSGGD